MRKIYIKTPKNQFGPLSIADFKRLIKNGLFTLNDFVWNFNTNSWDEINRVEEYRQYFSNNGNNRTAAKVVAIASGKGGVGKTALTASMAIELGNLGKKVVVVDADFGGPDLHEWMGISRPQVTMINLFKNRNTGLKDILVDTNYDNIKIICGEIGNIEASNPKYFQRLKLIRQLREVDADYVLIDQSPGVSYATVDIYLACDEGIIVTLPEPTSFMDAFNFIRSTLLRKLQKSLMFSDYAIEQLNEFANWDWRKYDQSMRSVLIQIDRRDPKAGLIFKGIVHQFQPKIVMNMVCDPSETREAVYFKESLKELLLVNSHYLGFIEYRKDFRKTIKEARPFVLTVPDGDETHISNGNKSFGAWIRNRTRLFSKHRNQPQEDHDVSDAFVERPRDSGFDKEAETKKFGLKLPVECSPQSV